MKIAILGWGSLIWNPRELGINGDWQKDGPLLPIEFARVSSDNRLTLVIRPDFKQTKVLWATSSFTSVEAARNNLKEREGTPNMERIGFLDFTTDQYLINRAKEEIKESLSSWNKSKLFDAIIWTDLQQNFKTVTKMEFTVHNAKRHLANLNQKDYDTAKEYILKAPEQIKTEFRQELTSYLDIRNEVAVTLNTSPTFFSVPREKLLHYYPEIVANSLRQFKGADNLASGGNYGMGISHLLISTEEMIKAFIVVLDAKGFDLRKVKGMDVFFRNHEIRFFIGFIVFIVTLFGDDGMRTLNEMRDNPGKTKQLSRLLKNKKELMLKLKWYFLRKLILIKRELRWFEKAEAFRQNGFYVDMKGNLISPQFFTETEYNETRQRIEKVNNAIQYGIEAFLSEDPELKEQVETVKTQFHQEKFYALIESELENRRKNKVTFFDKFSKFLSGLIESLKEKPPGYDDFLTK